MHFHVTPRHLKQEYNDICITQKVFVRSTVVPKLARPVHSA